MRVCVHSYEHLVSDCLQLVRLARGGSDALATRETAGECTLGLPSDLADKLTELPYFVSGQVRNACTVYRISYAEERELLYTRRGGTDSFAYSCSAWAWVEQSMGGAIALLVALYVQDAVSSGIPRALVGFGGAILVAPALGIGGRPPWVAEWLMKNVVVQTHVLIRNCPYQQIEL